LIAAPTRSQSLILLSGTAYHCHFAHFDLRERRRRSVRPESDRQWPFNDLPQKSGHRLRGFRFCLLWRDVADGGVHSPMIVIIRPQTVSATCDLPLPKTLHRAILAWRSSAVRGISVYWTEADIVDRAATVYPLVEMRA